MNKTIKKLINVVFMAVIAGASALAVDSEFKNTLTNVDLVKTSENNYTVNLYTSKKYASPVKVIKKSDLNYYILLPETKNISPNVNASSADIRSVNATSYAYSGVDVNNGYTKININTTHPINFNVATKPTSQRAADMAAIAQNTQQPQKAQKKNSVFSQKEDSLKQTAKADKEPVKAQTKTVAANKEVKQTASKVAAATTTTTEVKKQTTSTVKSADTAKNKATTTKVSLNKVSLNNASKPVKETKATAQKQTVQNKVASKVTSKVAEVKQAVKQAEKKAIKQDTAKAANKKEIAKKETVKNDTNKKEQLAKARNLRNKLAKITSQQLINKNKEIKQIEKIEKPKNVEPTQPVEQLKEDDEIVGVIAAVKINPTENEEITEEANKEEAKLEEAKETVEETTPEEAKKQYVSKKIDLKPALSKIKNGLITAFATISTGCKEGYATLTEKLYEYGLTIYDLLFMIFAGIFSFVAVLLILSKKQSQPKLKNKNELIDLDELVSEKEKAKAKSKKSNKNNGKYFVFENNVKQTELTIPAEAVEKKNFELVTYDPDLRETKETASKEEDDLDIIQKILKDDDFVDIKINKEASNEASKEAAKETIPSEEAPASEAVAVENQQTVAVEETTTQETAPEPVKQNENVTSPIGKEHVQKEDISDTELEPKLLATYNISPEQGFMFISYNNNVNLMGFVYDDVFVLHNYKTSKLDNYELQFRLVDKDEASSVYIVKTQKVKLLVKATKSSMNTEIIL